MMIKRRKKQEPIVKRIRGTEKVIKKMSKSNLVNLKKKIEGSQKKIRRRKKKRQCKGESGCWKIW